MSFPPLIYPHICMRHLEQKNFFELFAIFGSTVSSVWNKRRLMQVYIYGGHASSLAAYKVVCREMS